MKTLSLYFCLFLLLISCSNDDDGRVLSDLNTILSFSINEQQGLINNNEIVLELDIGTDISALAPIIEHTGASIVPANEVAQDFTNPVVYTVVAENGDTQEFIVTVTVAEPSNFNDITSFSINEQQGVINNNEITLLLDTGTDITALAPVIEHSGVSIAPENGLEQDFTEPVVYTVVAENGDTQEFIVTVTISSGTASGTEFITTWSTNEITIPTNKEFTYMYDVDWDNDGIVDESGIQGDVTHVFDTNEEHTIRITGVFPSIQFGGDSNGEDHANKIISVDQWGTGVWLSMANAFEFCEKLVILATDVPDLSSVTDLSSMFTDAFIVNPDISNWDTSNVTNMSFMFAGAKLANPDVSGWDTGKLVQLTAMFLGAELANPDISTWDISNVTNANAMFNDSALSTENYDKLLISFANQTRQNDVDFSANTTKYCSDEAQAARAVLIDDSNWDITDDGICF
ncbi:BspA family leucine-rich repeat surface protein [Aquimarina pacifica]|uniref:BspA family leucine-rich repeat surface protein n=1 Tax=Aquimarina pacifica TaxID=1296415 RepID=UPI00047054B3|nr:BspA family leucine-rich repeat surface protein [Aquimarina pacifica]